MICQPQGVKVMVPTAPSTYLGLVSRFRPRCSGAHDTALFRVATRPLSTQQTPSRKQRNRARKNVICGIWYIPNPSTTDPSTIISKLPQVQDVDRRTLNRAVFLATPGLAHWFQKDQDFLRDAINWMYAPAASNKMITSYTAIIDGLPSPQYFDEWIMKGSRPYRPAEGIAICLRDQVVTQQQPVEGDLDEGPALLQIQSQSSSSERRQERQELVPNIFASLTVPLANTLFVNGSRSTAFKDHWEPEADGQSIVHKHERQHFHQLQIDVEKYPRHMFQHSVPLHELTIQRKVISSMGNVVRQIEGDDGQPIRASMELEAVVPTFLAEHNTDGSTVSIQVFAIIMPPGAEASGEEVSKKDKSQSVTTTTTNQPHPFRRVAYQKTNHALWHGGQIYRVTSGGGGWGEKAGLLSLDPVTNFESQQASESGMFPDPDTDAKEIDVKEISNLSTLIPPGHTIQFFAARALQPHPPYYTDSDFSSTKFSPAVRSPEAWSAGNGQKLLIGTFVPDEAAPNENSDDDARAAPVIMLPGCFGAMSAGGASLTIKQRTYIKQSEERKANRPYKYNVLNEFKVDAPHATFKTSLAEHKSANKDDGDRQISINDSAGLDQDQPPRSKIKGDRQRKANLTDGVRIRKYKSGPRIQN